MELKEYFFGACIHLRRKELGLSLRELSRRSELGLSHLQYLEKGTKRPRTKTIRKLAKGLQLPEDILRTWQIRGVLAEHGVDGEIGMELRTLGSVSDTEREKILKTIGKIRKKRKPS